MEYVNIFVDDFTSLAQDPCLRRVRRSLLYVIDNVFRPVSPRDSPFRREPVSLKKLRKGDCSWDTNMEVLKWFIDTIDMTIRLPPRRVARLWEILDGIPPTQRRTSAKKWHATLGELRSMQLALPGACNMFGRLQKALSKSDKSRVSLDKGVHQAMEDFRWIASSLGERPTGIAELIPLAPAAEGHHDASVKDAGGVWFPRNSIAPREEWKAGVPVVWRIEWPDCIQRRLVIDKNPTGTLTNSDLELAGGLFQLDALVQTFDARKRTAVSKGDNLNATFWERRGSTTTDSSPAYLLRLFDIHQRYHRYLPRFDYLAGLSNHVADALSRDFHLTWPDIAAKLSPLLPQSPGFQVWTPAPSFVSAVVSALLRKQSPRESLLVVPPPVLDTGRSGSTTATSWASTPFSKPSATKCRCYKSSSSEFAPANLRPAEIESGLDRLKISYGRLRRRSSRWGPRIPA